MYASTGTKTADPINAFKEKRQIDVIAQEVVAVLPEVVYADR